MRKKYIAPNVELIKGGLRTVILAGSDTKGEGAQGTKPTTKKDEEITPGTGDGLAKNNHINAWENWDEY